MTHKLPHYKVNGQICPLKNDNSENILAKNIRVPEWWKDQEPKLCRTKTMLDIAKKQINMPDPSYDLDGDKVVSARDYFLAKQFDCDRDGKLNEVEKKNAIAGLENGYENNFKWNLEASGAAHSGRIVQIRGKIADSEDFGAVLDRKSVV